MIGLTTSRPMAGAYQERPTDQVQYWTPKKRQMQKEKNKKYRETEEEESGILVVWLGQWAETGNGTKTGSHVDVFFKFIFLAQASPWKKKIERRPFINMFNYKCHQQPCPFKVNVFPGTFLIRGIRIWILFEEYLNNFWRVFEYFLKIIWIIFEEYLNTFWRLFEYFLKSIWILFEEYAKETDKWFLSCCGSFTCNAHS